MDKSERESERNSGLAIHRLPNNLVVFFPRPQFQHGYNNRRCHCSGQPRDIPSADEDLAKDQKNVDHVAPSAMPQSRRTSLMENLSAMPTMGRATVGGIRPACHRIGRRANGGTKKRRSALTDGEAKEKKTARSSPRRRRRTTA